MTTLQDLLTHQLQPVALLFHSMCNHSASNLTSVRHLQLQYAWQHNKLNRNNEFDSPGSHTFVTTTTVPASFSGSGSWNSAECMLGSNLSPKGENFSTPFCFSACHRETLVSTSHARQWNNNKERRVPCGDKHAQNCPCLDQDAVCKGDTI